MIIFGWRTRRTVKGRGSFACPTCQNHTGYEHIHLKKWFTLFFVPLIPLGDQGTYVRCTGCGTNYRESILHRAAAPAQPAAAYGSVPPLPGATWDARPPLPSKPISQGGAAGGPPWAGPGTAAPPPQGPAPQGPPSWN